MFNPFKKIEISPNILTALLWPIIIIPLIIWLELASPYTKIFILLLLFIIIIYVCFWIYFAITNPDLVLSEKYNIKKLQTLSSYTKEQKNISIPGDKFSIDLELTSQLRAPLQENLGKSKKNKKYFI